MVDDFRLSEHFRFYEMTRTDVRSLLETNRKEACSFSGDLTKVCLQLLEPIREKVDAPVIVTSGFRGKTLNKAVGGSKYSQHMRGEAADIFVPGLALTRLFGIILEEMNLEYHQLLLEYGCIHISLPTGYKDGEVAVYDVATKRKTILKEGD